MKFFNFSRSGNAAVVEEIELQVPTKPLHRSELSRSVAKLSGFPRVDVEKIIGCYLEEIAASLQDGRPVVLSGFGKFKLRKPRSGSCRNPSTGRKIAAPKRKSISFQPSLVIKQKLNAGEPNHA